MAPLETRLRARETMASGVDHAPSIRYSYQADLISVAFRPHRAYHLVFTARALDDHWTASVLRFRLGHRVKERIYRTKVSIRTLVSDDVAPYFGSTNTLVQ